MYFPALPNSGFMALVLWSVTSHSLSYLQPTTVQKYQIQLQKLIHQSLNCTVFRWSVMELWPAQHCPTLRLGWAFCPAYSGCICYPPIGHLATTSLIWSTASVIRAWIDVTPIEINCDDKAQGSQCCRSSWAKEKPNASFQQNGESFQFEIKKKKTVCRGWSDLQQDRIFSTWDYEETKKKIGFIWLTYFKFYLQCVLCAWFLGEDRKSQVGSGGQSWKPPSLASHTPVGISTIICYVFLKKKSLRNENFNYLLDDKVIFTFFVFLRQCCVAFMPLSPLRWDYKHQTAYQVIYGDELQTPSFVLARQTPCQLSYLSTPPPKIVFIWDIKLSLQMFLGACTW